jgi:hypothetical protein
MNTPGQHQQQQQTQQHHMKFKASIRLDKEIEREMIRREREKKANCKDDFFFSCH